MMFWLTIYILSVFGCYAFLLVDRHEDRGLIRWDFVSTFFKSLLPVWNSSLVLVVVIFWTVDTFKTIIGSDRLESVRSWFNKEVFAKK